MSLFKKIAPKEKELASENSKLNEIKDEMENLVKKFVDGKYFDKKKNEYIILKYVGDEHDRERTPIEKRLLKFLDIFGCEVYTRSFLYGYEVEKMIDTGELIKASDEDIEKVKKTMFIDFASKFDNILIGDYYHDNDNHIVVVRNKVIFTDEDNSTLMPTNVSNYVIAFSGVNLLGEINDGYSKTNIKEFLENYTKGSGIYYSSLPIIKK